MAVCYCGWCIFDPLHILMPKCLLRHFLLLLSRMCSSQLTSMRFEVAILIKNYSVGTKEAFTRCRIASHGEDFACKLK